MITSAVPQIDCDHVMPGFVVTDVLAAADFYVQKLGFGLGFTAGDPPTIAGVNLGEVSVHLLKGTPNPQGSSAYFIVGDADELFGFQRDSGVSVVEPPADRPYGLRDYRVRDAYGNLLAFGHYAPSTQPPLPIERVDVTLRLEKRLAALLDDLARYKQMSLTSCLEETLLHSFDSEGGNVHSPHTKSQLRHIQELKQKHGIDYDAHDSYRFAER